MLNLNTTLSEAELKRLEQELVIWLTTVREDGLPMPTPVWFLWTGRDFLIYSQPETQKVLNITRNPQVALNLNSDAWGGEVLILHCEAEISPGSPPALQNDAYVEKYSHGITDIQMTPESFSADYSTAIRVRPLKVRRW